MACSDKQYYSLHYFAGQIVPDQVPGNMGVLSCAKHVFRRLFGIQRTKCNEMPKINYSKPMRITWFQRCVQENLFSGRKVGAKFLGVMTKISWTHKNDENAWNLNMRVLFIRKFELDHWSGLFRQAILLFTSLRWANWARPGSRKCGRAVVREACFSNIIWNPSSEMQWDVKN